MSGWAGGAAAPPLESTQGGDFFLCVAPLEDFWLRSGRSVNRQLPDCSSETVVLRVSQRGWDTAWTPSVGEDGNLASVVWWD